MVLKPNDETKAAMYILFFLVLAVLIMFAVMFDLSFWMYLPTAIILIWLSVNVWITYTRTITFSDEGCYVELWHFRKMYTWDMLYTKRFERYNVISRIWERRSPYSRGCVFSPHKVRRSVLVKAATRGILSLFPFSHIYVYFYPIETAQPPKSANPYYYAVNENEFREKMHEWGIVVEEIT